MNVRISAAVHAYLEGMRKVERAMKKQRRRELITNIIGVVAATVLVSYILWSAWCMISGAAW